MGTLKTTLKVESTDLFPTPVSFTNVNNNGINGNFNGFNTVTIAAGASAALNSSVIDATGAYLYLQSPATNGTGIAVGYSGQTAATTGFGGGTGSLIYLSPGDTAFVPVGMGVTAANIHAWCPGGTATLYFFIGEK